MTAVNPIEQCTQSMLILAQSLKWRSRNNFREMLRSLTKKRPTLRGVSLLWSKICSRNVKKAFSTCGKLKGTLKLIFVFDSRDLIRFSNESMASYK